MSIVHVHFIAVISIGDWRLSSRSRFRWRNKFLFPVSPLSEIWGNLPPPAQFPRRQRSQRMWLLIKIWPTLREGPHIHLSSVTLRSRSTMYHMVPVPYTEENVHPVDPSLIALFLIKSQVSNDRPRTNSFHSVNDMSSNTLAIHKLFRFVLFAQYLLFINNAHEWLARNGLVDKEGYFYSIVCRCGQIGVFPDYSDQRSTSNNNHIGPAAVHRRHPVDNSTTEIQKAPSTVRSASSIDITTRNSGFIERLTYFRLGGYVLCVCLLTGSLKNYWINVHEILRNGWT